jgi:hypothetical protein
VVARLKIHKSKLDEFKGLAAECKRIVEEKDKGTLQYDWFLNKDHTECVVLERYQDSNAIMEHMANLGETMGQLFSTGDFSAEVYGTPSLELINASEGLDVRFYQEL